MIENLTWIYGIVGISLACGAWGKVTSLEKKLKDLGVLDENYCSD